MNDSHVYPSEFASNRKWPFLESVNSQSPSTLQTCWSASLETYSKAQTALAQISIDEDLIHCLAVAGSLGRMEVQSHSDFDLLVFLNDTVATDNKAVARQTEEIWQCLENLGLRLPKSWGIFADAASPSMLLDPSSLGDLNESRSIFGKRIQVLLDCQPLTNPENFSSLQKQILSWYATAFVSDGDDSQWRYLINDLVRYYKSYSAWHQFKLTVEHDDSWYIRNAKLGSSRLIMFAGLLLQLGSLSHHTTDKVNDLGHRLRQTPLERVVSILGTSGLSGSQCEDFIKHYDTYFRVIANAEWREAMVHGAPVSIDDLPAPLIDGYREIHEANEKLRSQLTKFIFNNQHQWHRNFLEALLF